MVVGWGWGIPRDQKNALALGKGLVGASFSKTSFASGGIMKGRGMTWGS